MKFQICSCCNKVICEEVNACKNCGSNICNTCKKNAGASCIFCGGLN